jgi:MFS family permease
MKQIYLAYVITFLRNSWFFLGIWALYYLRFTDYAGIGLIEAIMIATLAILEIPTGAIADLFGRVKTVALAIFLIGVGNFIMGAAHTTMDLIVSVVCMSIGAAFYSGTFEAIVYDHLVDQHKESLYPSVIGKMNAITMVAFAIAAPLGGFLYQISPRIPFYVTGTVLLIGAGLALFLTEPQRSSSQPSLQNYLNQIGDGVKQIINKQHIHHIMPLMVIGMFGAIAYEVLDDILFVNYGFTSIQLGLIAGLAYIIYAAIGLLTPKITRINNKWLVRLCFGTLMAITFLVAPLLGMWVGGMVVIIRESINHLLEGYTSVELNQLIDSKHRATALSAFSMMKNGLYVVMAFWIGKTMNEIGPKHFAGYLGALMLLLVIGYEIRNCKLLRRCGLCCKHE